MKKTILFFTALVAVTAGTYATETYPDPREIVMLQAMRLYDIHDYAASVTYEVLLPSADEPVTYRLKVASTPNATDTIGHGNYLIEWSLDHDGKKSEGFTAYFDGNFFRYKDYRLQEYHAAEDMEPFAPGGDIAKGIQQQTQFADVLPPHMTMALGEMLNDSSYTVTVTPDEAKQLIIIDGVRTINGSEAMRAQYQFDRDLLPVKYEITTNPGGMGEHVVTAVYDYSDDDMLSAPDSEAELAERYSEIFNKYRERDFTIDNLPGRPLPAFSATTPTRERYRHTKNSGFAAPTVIALLDSGNEKTADIISQLRAGVDSAATRTDLIMAFGGNDAEEIEKVSDSLRPGEFVLMSARGLIRDCGATVLPVVMVCDRDGIVKDLIIGDNNAIADFVIKETADLAD